MNWNSVFSWALHAVEDQAKKAAITEVQKAANALSTAVEKNSPDMAHLIQDQITKAATTAVAGILSRKG